MSVGKEPFMRSLAMDDLDLSDTYRDDSIQQPNHDDSNSPLFYNRLLAQNRELRKSVQLLKDTYNLTSARLIGCVIDAMMEGDRRVKPLLQAIKNLQHVSTNSGIYDRQVPRERVNQTDRRPPGSLSEPLRDYDTRFYDAYASNRNSLYRGRPSRDRGTRYNDTSSRNSIQRNANRDMVYKNKSRYSSYSDPLRDSSRVSVGSISSIQPDNEQQQIKRTKSRYHDGCIDCDFEQTPPQDYAYSSREQRRRSSSARRRSIKSQRGIEDPMPSQRTIEDPLMSQGILEDRVRSQSTAGVDPIESRRTIDDSTMSHVPINDTLQSHRTRDSNNPQIITDNQIVQPPRPQTITADSRLSQRTTNDPISCQRTGEDQSSQKRTEAEIWSQKLINDHMKSHRYVNDPMTSPQTTEEPMPPQRSRENSIISQPVEESLMRSQRGMEDSIRSQKESQEPLRERSRETNQEPMTSQRTPMIQGRTNRNNTDSNGYDNPINWTSMKSPDRLEERLRKQYGYSEPAANGSDTSVSSARTLTDNGKRTKTFDMQYRLDSLSRDPNVSLFEYSKTCRHVTPNSSYKRIVTSRSVTRSSQSGGAADRSIASTRGHVNDRVGGSDSFPAADRHLIDRPIDEILLPNVTVQQAYSIACQVRPISRMIGEIAYQLDCRILDEVFLDTLSAYKRRGFYGINPKTIVNHIRSQSVDGDGNPDMNMELTMRYRFNDVLLKLARWGYHVDIHGDFSERIVRSYKLIQSRDDRKLLDEYASKGARVMRCLIYRTVPDSESLHHVLILFDCLSFMANENKTAIFQW